ncbi:MFS transporter [Streptomyces paludis]|uniref:MFS transporter n=1 Tax=Streptomyces paludis TaxID=2282738 RepID=A0A345HXQ1_9ACTN|nr:MFS transporter [Streptomyces paludis]AXG81475.1 MFS transporter [Streptomyces paludis]
MSSSTTPPTTTTPSNTPTAVIADGVGEQRPDPALPSRKLVVRASVICFLAWVFSVYDFTLFGTLLPKISEDFGWSNATAANVVTGVTAGTFVVSLCVGPILDRFGRRPALMITSAGAAFTSAATALVMGPVSMVAVRAFSGFGYSEEVVNTVYLKEIYGKHPRRGLYFSFVQSGWPVGALVGAGVTALTLPTFGWRGSFVIAAVPALVIAVLMRTLPESPVFLGLKKARALRAEGRTAEAVAVERSAGIESDARKPGLREVFAPALRRHTLCLSAAWLLNWMGIQIFSVLGTTVLVEAKGVSFSSALLVLVLANLAGFFGYVFHGWLGDRVGRRTTIIIGWTCGGAAMTAMLFGPTTTGAVIALYALGLFFLTGPYSAMLFYMSESFPEQVRGLGANVAHTMGPIGAIVGSALLGALLGAGVSMTMAAFVAGAVGIFGSGLVMLGARRDERATAPDALPTAA